MRIARPPDGKLLVLERRFSWAGGLAMRIRSVPFAMIKPGAQVDGPELIFADMGSQVDNMEGLSAGGGGWGGVGVRVSWEGKFCGGQGRLLVGLVGVGWGRGKGGD